MTFSDSRPFSNPLRAHLTSDRLRCPILGHQIENQQAPLRGGDLDLWGLGLSAPSQILFILF